MALERLFELMQQNISSRAAIQSEEGANLLRQGKPIEAQTKLEEAARDIEKLGQLDTIRDDVLNKLKEVGVEQPLADCVEPSKALSTEERFPNYTRSERMVLGLLPKSPYSAISAVRLARAAFPEKDLGKARHKVHVIVGDLRKKVARDRLRLVTIREDEASYYLQETES